MRASAGTDHPLPADQATVRRMNLGLLMRSLATGGPRSRARLADDTGLNKATVSSLVTDLIERRLVVEGHIDRGGIGRPGRVVEVDTKVVRCLGLELNVDYLAGVITDLTGRVLARRHFEVSMRELGPGRGLSQLAELARALVADSGATPNQVETLNVSVPGLIDVEAGLLAFAPNLHWRQVDVVHTMMGRLRWDRARISVENDANLGAMAEYSVGSSAGSSHLLYLVGEIGVGAGLVIDGRIQRGRTGFAGEVGHMAIGRPDARCGCGRLGCWETAVGMRSLVNAASDPADQLVDNDLDVSRRLTELAARARAGEPRTLAALTEMGRWLGIGTSVLVNVLDPEVIVFGGYFTALAEYLRPAVEAELAARVVAEPATCRVEFSKLGFEAPALGAAHAGIDLLVGDPSLVAPR